MARPRIVINGSDHTRLMQLANALLDRRPDLAENLLGELERARVVASSKVPADTVQMGSIVEYRVGEGAGRRVELVYPGEADIERSKVSILTPIGTALLGLSVGQTIDFVANDGRRQSLTVVATAAVTDEVA
jgi:regulator of nucleoside diphosphate kinase